MPYHLALVTYPYSVPVHLSRPPIPSALLCPYLISSIVTLHPRSASPIDIYILLWVRVIACLECYCSHSGRVSSQWASAAAALFLSLSLSLSRRSSSLIVHSVRSRYVHLKTPIFTHMSHIDARKRFHNLPCCRTVSCKVSAAFTYVLPLCQCTCMLLVAPRHRDSPMPTSAFSTPRLASGVACKQCCCLNTHLPTVWVSAVAWGFVPIPA